MIDQSDAHGEDEEDFSLDDLGAAYARAMAESGMLAERESTDVPDEPSTDPPASAPSADRDTATAHEPEEDEAGGITPMSIVEAALFVGHPENLPLTAAQIAATMRGVSAEEVEQIIDDLNGQYENHHHAYRIARRDGGYVFGLSEQMRLVRNMFYGKVRETRLTQGAIDVLALVAYQPGVTAATLSQQRGKEASSIVNQMVRRELLEMRRESQDGGKPVPTYYPTSRLLNLLGLRSLDDLPQVDETDVAPRI